MYGEIQESELRGLRFETQDIKDHLKKKIIEFEFHRQNKTPQGATNTEGTGIKSFPLPEGEVAGAQKIRSKAGTKISKEAGESHGSPFTDFVKNICRLQNKQRIPGLYEGDLRSQEASTEKVKQQNPRKLKLEKELPPLSTENLNALVTPYFKNGVPNCNALAKHIMKTYEIKTNNKSVKKFLQLKGYV